MPLLALAEREEWIKVWVTVARCQRVLEWLRSSSDLDLGPVEIQVNHIRYQLLQILQKQPLQSRDMMVAAVQQAERDRQRWPVEEVESVLLANPGWLTAAKGTTGMEIPSTFFQLIKDPSEWESVPNLGGVPASSPSVIWALYALNPDLIDTLPKGDPSILPEDPKIWNNHLLMVNLAGNGGQGMTESTSPLLNRLPKMDQTNRDIVSYFLPDATIPSSSSTSTTSTLTGTPQEGIAWIAEFPFQNDVGSFAVGDQMTLLEYDVGVATVRKAGTLSPDFYLPLQDPPKIELRSGDWFGMVKLHNRQVILSDNYNMIALEDVLKVHWMRLIRMTPPSDRQLVWIYVTIDDPKPWQCPSLASPARREIAYPAWILGSFRSQPTSAGDLEREWKWIELKEHPKKQCQIRWHEFGIRPKLTLAVPIIGPEKFKAGDEV